MSIDRSIPILYNDKGIIKVGFRLKTNPSMDGAVYVCDGLHNKIWETAGKAKAIKPSDIVSDWRLEWKPNN